MKKGFALLVMLLALLLLASGCNLVGYDEALDNAQVVATVNGTDVTKAEWLVYRDYMANYYQQYYQQTYGVNLPLDDETLANYGDSALEEMIESIVLEDKAEELGFLPLSDEEAADAEAHADSMVDLYKQLVRYQDFPGIETVEEEYARLTATPDEASEATPDEASEATPDEATPDEATPAEPQPTPTIAPEDLTATITDAELDAMITERMEAYGYTRDYFIQSETMDVQNDKLREYAIADVSVSDDEVRAKFDSLVESQKTSYDATPTLYATAVNNGSDVYYAPEGYRGVKNLLIGLEDDDQDALNELNSTLTTAQSMLTSVQGQLDDLDAEDTSEYDEEALAAYQEQKDALTEQKAEAEATIADTQKQIDETTEAAFAKVLPQAEEALAKAQAGEDFDALIETYGDDSGMRSEPAKTQGYLICDGLSLYVPEFQDAAMALENVGDISDLVKTDYGYHILKYEMDIPSGAVEYTDEIAEDLKGDMLTEAQDAAYEAAVTQWVSEADVKTYPKRMK